ncbi:MAG: hypothetical protein ACFFE8_02745 [Candidatus Heimdallarchaeota archaeon]
MSPLTANQLQYTILAFISLLLTLLGFYLTLSVYRSSRSRPLIILTIIHLLLVPYFLLHTLLYTIANIEFQLSLILYRAGVIILILLCFLLVLFIELLRADKPYSILITAVTFGVGMSIILAIQPESFLWDPGIGPYFADFPRTILVVEMLLLTLIVIYQISHFIPYIPQDYSRASILFFLGCIFPILVPAILIATKISLAIWGIEIFALAIGILFVILAIVIDARVLRVLPFNVYRLSVMNMNMGLSIFDALFNTKKQGPDVNILIPHLMTANVQFVQSVIDRTEKIQLIKTDNYIFLFETDQKIVTFLIADKVSLLLRSALKEFTRQFVRDFGSDLDSANISIYAKADPLIRKHFSFLPQHRIISISE